VPANVDLIVDLTAEFPVAPGIIGGRTYYALPVLDASMPNEKTLCELIYKVAAWQGNVYLHCALGRGRSATVAAGVLVARGLAADVEQAVAMVKQARPVIGLRKVQRELLESALAGVGEQA
jgi:protein-tyrosine phosphatase